MGRSRQERLLVVGFTERPDAICLINAREASKQERRDYEENLFR